MSEEPALTLGLPVYNGEQFLEQALESMLGQTFEDFELVVVDNASTDRTAEISRDYAARDPRVSYLRNERNLGAAANYNRAFSRARGRYFKWVAHDDTYHGEFLASCIEVLESCPSAVACYSAASFIDGDGAPLGFEEETLDYSVPRPSTRFGRWILDKSDGWCHPVTGVIRTEVLARTPLIGSFSGSDVALVAELLLRGEIRRTRERLFRRRDHSGRSAEAHRSTAARTYWFNTSARHGRAYMPLWRLGIEFSRSVARVPMTAVEKSACTVIMAKWFLRSRSALGGELIHWAETGRGPALPPNRS